MQHACCQAKHADAWVPTTWDALFLERVLGLLWRCVCNLTVRVTTGSGQLPCLCDTARLSLLSTLQHRRAI